MMFEKGMNSVEINQKVTNISHKVKEVVVRSEEMVGKMCDEKLSKAKSIH